MATSFHRSARCPHIGLKEGSRDVPWDRWASTLSADRMRPCTRRHRNSVGPISQKARTLWIDRRRRAREELADVIAAAAASLRGPHAYTPRMPALERISAETAVHEGLRCSFCGREPAA